MGAGSVPKLNSTHSNVNEDKKKAAHTTNLGDSSAAPMIAGKKGSGGGQTQNQHLAKCPFLASEGKKWPKPKIRKRVPLSTMRGTHVISKGTKDLLKDIGGGGRIRSMCTRFYAKAFKDSVLSKFMFETDDAKAHGKRLGDWIVEKMGGEGKPWTESGRYGLRQESHYNAWWSNKREPEKLGQRFKLDDCRIWMRLMFWAAREEGLAEHKPFWSWYCDFIRHFIRVYERTAPPYTQESADWSCKEGNLKEYVAGGRDMKEVIGFHVKKKEDPFQFFT
mmetsp:Transcript_10176/g.16455  ORF Transcript_10176/g.16455 Transcript_10176/m.16455 type:complete len:277 (-) Transcript_10176:103-933(-)